MFNCFLKFARKNAQRIYEAKTGLSGKLLFPTGIASGTIVSFNSISSCSCLPEEASNDNDIYSVEEVASHDSIEKGLWVSYKGGVYDITKFIHNHPGGVDKLMLSAGKNLNELWKLPEYRQHYKSPLVFELLEEMRIGTLEKYDANTDVHPELDCFTGDKLKYPSNHIYDCIVVGSGISGLQCASDLVHKHNLRNENVLILEAQDYVGGRVRQIGDFVKGVNIDVGAEFLHGSGTRLTKFAEENNQPLEELFCWAHGDGGPLPQAVNKGFGLYWIADTDTSTCISTNESTDMKNSLDSAAVVSNKNENKNKKRLIRFDAKDQDFVSMNELLWGIAELNEEDYSDDISLQNYLDSKHEFSGAMIDMAAGGFANTLCTNSRDLSLKQCIKWCRMWHEEEGEDGDYYFKNSYKCLVDHLKHKLQIELNSPVSIIQTPLHTQDIALVKVTTKHGISYYAKQIVVTASPHVLKSDIIEFQPPLPLEVNEALDSTMMHNIVKVILKFSKPCWPKDLHGMIMTDKDFLLPEIWFRKCSEQKVADEPANAYAIGFTTADYAARLSALPKEEVLKRVVSQLDVIVSKLEPQHMAADITELDCEQPSDIPLASEVFLGGMFWDWNPKHHPYIGGGYCSSKAGTKAYLAEKLSLPVNDYLCFAGEATNLPGATAHAALESGERAALRVAEKLR